MVVTSKQPEKEPSILFYLSILILIFSIFSYFILFGLEKEAETVIKKVEKKLEEKKQEEIISLEKKVQEWEKKIKSFNLLLQNHSFPSQFFPFFQEKILPKIFIKKFSLDLKDLKVEATGETNEFDILGQQIMVFEKEPRISNLEIGDFNLTSDQKIEFKLKFNFDKEIIIPKIK
jgi:hypothetical protein